MREFVTVGQVADQFGALPKDVSDVIYKRLATMPKLPMPRVLLYKRTHDNDPHRGCFGSHDCMGAVRARRYDAVIGIGGVGPEATRNGLARKLNWIGIGPEKTGNPKRPYVTFDHFLQFNDDGPPFASLAPILAARIYGDRVRVAMTFSDEENRELRQVLKLAASCPPSPCRPLRKQQGKSSRERKRCEPPTMPPAKPCR